MEMPGRGKKAKKRSTGRKNSILTGKKLEEAVSRVLYAVYVAA
jgi:hypothetical protein